MRRMAVVVFLAVTAALGASGCDPKPINERYGQLLAPADVKDCPAGCVPYVTAEGDLLYVLAERAYGKGYKMHFISSLPENVDTLKAATKADGSLKKGYILFLPAKETGGQIVPEKRWYFGGTSKR